MKKIIYVIISFSIAYVVAGIVCLTHSLWSIAALLFMSAAWAALAAKCVAYLIENTKEIENYKRELEIKKNLVLWHEKQMRLRDTRIKQLNNTIKQFRENRDKSQVDNS